MSLGSVTGKVSELLWHCHGCLVFTFLSCLLLTQDPVKDFSLHLNVLSLNYLCSRTFLFFSLWHCSVEVSCFTEYFSFRVHLLTGVPVAGLRGVSAKAKLCPSAPRAHEGLRGHSAVTGIVAPGLRRGLLDFSSVCTSPLDRFWLISGVVPLRLCVKNAVPQQSFTQQLTVIYWYGSQTVICVHLCSLGVSIDSWVIRNSVT